MIKRRNTVAPEVMSKPKIMDFLKTAGAVEAIYLLICLCPLDGGGKTFTKLSPPLSPQKKNNNKVSVSLWMNEWVSV